MEFNENLTIEEWTNNNSLAISIFNNKYKHNDETFMQTVRRISGDNEEIMKMILNKMYLPGGRICSNRGLDKEGRKVSLSNCYVLPQVEDNIESIFDTAKEMARTYSMGGGVGVSISKLSFNGAKVRNAANCSSGAVSFMELYSHITGLISQNGRRGALMISMDVSHPDIEEFIDIKNDLNKVTKANISVQISDEFMEAVKSDKDFTLYFKREETGEEKTKVVKARDLFHKICYNAWNMAEPGVLFWDTINKYNILSEDENYEYAGVNPCVTGDTLILTDSGYYPIKELVGSMVTIWNGYEWSDVYPKVTGINQPIRYIETSDGSFLKCTDYHKFILSDGSRVEAKNLKEGDRLIKFEFPVIPGWIGMDEKIAYTKGFMAGDGTVNKYHNGRKLIYLYGDKKNLYQYIEYEKFYDQTESSNRYCLQISKDTEWMNDKFWIPNESFTIQTRLAWLAGYIDSDGTLNSSEGSIAISSINQQHLYNLKIMLTTLGINSTIGIANQAGIRSLPNHKGSNSEYNCKTTYRLVISAYNVSKLINIGLRTHRVPLIADPNRNASRFITITKNISLGIEPEVYCFNEPKNHSGIFNGIITAQCSEEPLPAYGACLLGSINLSEFVDNPFTDEATFNIEEFTNKVDKLIRELNIILDEGIPLHPLKQQSKTASDWRQIGLGIMGLADTFIKMGITYGSEDSIELSDDIGFIMADQAIKTSALLAKKYGTYPMYNKEAVLKSKFFTENTSITTHGLVEANGLRNSQILTIAPTGSISNVLGVSGGIEPIFAISYTRKTETLHGEDTYYKVYTPIVKEYMEKFNIKDENDLPEYFITSQEIKYEDRIKVQAAWQKHIDASISSTVNLPESATVEDIEDLYMKAWENGLKGITVYRDNCKRSGILTTNKKESVEKSIGEPNTVTEESVGLARGEILKVSDHDGKGLKRKLITGCGSLHCVALFHKETGQLLETYLSKGSTGGCNNFMVGLSRMISQSARLGASIYDIVDQLKSTGSCPSYAVRRATKGDTSLGSCCPMAAGFALLDMYNEFNHLGKYANKENNIPDKNTYMNKSTDTTNLFVGVEKLSEDALCPQCGSKLINEGGCNQCKNCGWTKCD